MCSQCVGVVVFLGLICVVGCSDDGADTTTASVVAPDGTSVSDPASYRVSGAVIAAAGSIADVDTNDLWAPQDDNDDPFAAQALPNPVTVGGYVNRRRRGSRGSSYETGDEVDFYRVALRDGDRITLAMASTVGESDLDVFVLAGDGIPLDSSSGLFSRTETIVMDAATAGERWLVVSAYRGASTYTLSIGREAIAIPQASSLSLSADFVPGEIIVAYTDTAVVSGLPSQTGSRLRALGMTRSSQGSPLARELIVLGDAQQRRARFQALNLKDSWPDLGGEQPNLKLDTLRFAKWLAAQPDVRYAEPNVRRRLLLVPNDEYYDRQWHYPLINLPAAWELTQGDGAITVAVIDTGILPDHPDHPVGLALADSYDFISDPVIGNDGDGRDPDATDPGDQVLIGRSSFHGTHIAGTIAAATDNAEGVAGIAPQTRVMVLRALGLGGVGEDFDFAEAIRYAVGLPNVTGRLPSQVASVLNLSFGGTASSQTLQEAVRDAYAAGAVMVAAAGNGGDTVENYPAAYPEVLAVSAIGPNGELAGYSSRGSAQNAWIDLAAPGGDSRYDMDGDGFKDGVLSTTGNDPGLRGVAPGYEFLEGTSMAAAHVSGVIALMAAVARGMDVPFGPAPVSSWLQAGWLTADIGALGHDPTYGYGMIDAYLAVRAVTGNEIELPPVLQTMPLIVNMGSVDDTAFVTVRNVGGEADDFAVTDVTSDQPWLGAVPADVSAAGLGTYRVTVARDELPSQGFFSGRLTFVSNMEASTQVTVTLQQMTLSTRSDLGFIYVLLVDSTTGSVAAQVQGNATDGQLAFSFNEIPFGSYWLIAGSDMDNDGYICEAGEACGAYRTVARLSPILVDQDRTRLDFTGRFGVELTERNSAGQLLSTMPSVLARGIALLP